MEQLENHVFKCDQKFIKPVDLDPTKINKAVDFNWFDNLFVKPSIFIVPPMILV